MSEIFDEDENWKDDSPFSMDALRHIAKEKVLWKLGVEIHCVVFIFTNIFLIFLNLFVNPGVLWSVYVLSGWFVGIGTHLAIYLIYSRGIIGDTKKGLILHVVISSLGMQLLFWINFISDFSNLWFIWPISAMILAIICHFSIFMLFLNKTGADGKKKSWIDKKIDEELERARKRGDY